MSTNELASWVFGAVSLLYLAAVATYLIIKPQTQNLPPAASFILGFFCATASGFLTYFLTGSIGLNFNLPGRG